MNNREEKQPSLQFKPKIMRCRQKGIPNYWMENCPIHYQAHLERIGDYLIQGQGIWWRYIDTGVEFFDIESPANSNPPTPSLQHFRTASLNDVFWPNGENV
jgi:hypothetical protein